jgi:excisionase family DNA binding protein
MTTDGVRLPADDGVLVMIRRLLRSTDIDRAADRQTRQFMESQRETAVRIDQLPADSQWHTEDVAEYTGLSKRSVQQYASEMGGVRIGRRWRFDRVEVTTWWSARLLWRNAL